MLNVGDRVSAVPRIKPNEISVLNETVYASKKAPRSVRLGQPEVRRIHDAIGETQSQAEEHCVLHAEWRQAASR